VKVLCLGGGPAGLYFAISMKLRDPSHQVTVLERNKADDTFGWGVVLSDDAMARMKKNDPQSYEAIKANFAYWDDIAVVHRGRTPGVGRARLCRDRADEDAADPAGAGARAGGGPAVRDRVQVG
jgi:2-polyprenyl-6-methoxyphenol hydroxylase-like FAD-dependent oxidoreductase